jgi:ribosome maturation factor RimP
MMKDRRTKIIEEVAQPIVTGLGFSLWGVHAPSAGKRTVVSIFVDGENGINLDECAQISRDVGLALEVEDVMPGPYVLEVSSPGLERRFFEPGQMRAYLGRRVKAELLDMVGGRRNFAGILTEAGETYFILEDDEHISHRIEWEQVKKARLIHEF